MKFILTCLIVSNCCLVWSQKSEVIMPMPKHLVLGTSTFTLNAQATIFTPNENLIDQVNYLRQGLFDLKKINFIQRGSQKASIILALDKKAESKNPEAYKLSIKPQQILITAQTPNGVFNGIQSLLQLVKANANNENTKLQVQEINDEPLYHWRGLMLDESRHFFGINKIKQLIDWMALYKLNRLHWHLTDEPAWRIEIKKYPKLTLVGGIGSFTDAFLPAQYYRQDQIKEIVSYAKARFIEVIPEIDMPGHATAANAAYPEYSGGGSKEHPEFTFNPGKPQTYQYLTDILKETQLLFPANILHIGGDEVSYGTDKWHTDTAILSLKKQMKLNTDQGVEKYFMRRMADSVFALNSKVSAWDEALSADLPVDKTIIFWWRHDKPDQLNQSLDKGYKTVLCPRLPFYFDFVQDSTHRYGRKWDKKYNDILSVYHFDITKLVTNPNSLKNILGIQANLWTETAQSEQRLDYLLFPRIAALAERAWSNPRNKNDEDFLDRLKIHLPWYKKAGLNFYNPFNPPQTSEPVGKSKMIQNFKD
ncbi:beta-N-acetylhexosaminidase [Pedobacter aquatilis]|uniref:beta-N-acetylhexosaminidase n=1 Tax=Pedobacter aquatilis TaxID=351343 RepID=UPI0029301B61|nr:beta-N-acetylhexosaminidase [Pedobacter aquatilis]